MNKDRAPAKASLPRSFAPMRQQEFSRFSQFIQTECGIKLPPAKKTMLEARLQKRLRSLGMPDFPSYCDYVFSPEGVEVELYHLLDAVTTNTTHFFREPRHFEILAGQVLPEWATEGRGRHFRLWSAGCSTGEEPYTLAMILDDFGEEVQGFDFNIFASDISTRVLKHAANAVYTMDKADSIPIKFKRKYLLRSKDKSKNLVRVVPELRRKISFQRINFMEQFDIERMVDVVFCRNVLIYFERPTQEAILSKLCRFVETGGYVFIGHSESLTGMNLPLTQIHPTVYRRS